METQTNSQLIGVGYEGLSIDSFLAKLSLRDVHTVVDVRLTPISRKRGFSKNGLAEELRLNGIGYLHLPALGNPKDNRDGFASAASEDSGARARYVDGLANERGDEALDSVLRLLDKGTVALLCFEADEVHCHRHEVLAAVRGRMEKRVLASA